MEGLAQWISSLASLHPVWTFLTMFVVSFGESLAFVSLFFPGTAVLMAAGALVPGAWPLFWPIALGAVSGATVGDGVSYWIGRRFGPEIRHVWPFNRRPDLIERGVSLFEAHGGKGVFIGRFFGPVRAVIPPAAGILRMKPGRFWIVNIVSAIIWTPLVIFPGAIVGDSIERFGAGDQLLASALLALVVFGGVGLWIVSRRCRR
jgi:membrane protein DedA with SNARE-associated domain